MKFGKVLDFCSAPAIYRPTIVLEHFSHRPQLYTLENDSMKD